MLLFYLIDLFFIFSQLIIKFISFQFYLLIINQNYQLVLNIILDI